MNKDHERCIFDIELTDEGAAEVLAFLEILTDRFQSCYFTQIRRHYRDKNRHQRAYQAQQPSQSTAQQALPDEGVPF